MSGFDFREALLLGLYALYVKTKPVEKWANITDRLYPLERIERFALFRQFRDSVAAFFGPSIDAGFVRGLWRNFCITDHRRKLEVVAEKLDAGHPPSIRLEGREHIDQAIAAGKGAILWNDNFMHQPLIGKRAIAAAGYDSLQLSSFDHGFSNTVLGRRFLNPIQTSVEDPYVGRRISFDETSVLAATREVRNRLAQSGVVQIGNNAYIGRKILHMPIGASAWLPIATAPLNFAWKYKAVLLPVAVTEPQVRDYRVVVGAPLLVDGADRDRAYRAAAQNYVHYLEPVIRAHPEQWSMWTNPIDQPPGGEE